MAILNAWQRIDRVITGSPWGDGADGSATISSDPNTRATITGTATQNTGTAGSSAFANGDLVLLHQTQGTGVGQWEINRVASGGGTTSLTFQEAHHYTYGTGAQIIKIPRYTTVNLAAHSPTAWNGSTGGIEVILGKTSVTSSANLTADSSGFAGGQSITTPDANGYRGEGSVGASAQAVTPSGNAGSGGYGDAAFGSQGNGGSGGGNGSAGSDGLDAGGGGGAESGSADGTATTFGGGGGSGGQDDGDSNPTGAGGRGGGIIIIFTKSLSLSNFIYNRGASGSNSVSNFGGAGGGGAGGSIILACETATLGTNNMVSTGGAGGGVGKAGGVGGTGRIAIHHSGAVSGTTSPTFTDVSDPTLAELASVATGYSFFM